MAQVTFYVLNSEQQPMDMACELLLARLQQRQRIAVVADNRKAAEAFDELLWQRPADRFIPHNLLGEGPAGGAPVVIGWDQPFSAYGYTKHCLLNLSENVPDDAHKYRQIVDFVPSDEEGKTKARERYRQYRRLGFELSTQTLTNNE
ncbi:DNA polymerase III subunit chi [Aliidiomarina halalkaliphila]|uniref:DNA polymerase III subunit chi n=1 Tax=Aliidiomarina halalkaliphila TaxID=2593535 RepID=A0A552WYM9_9GAMM|nr:DNA polymerase III subunit chi [Aliidiomarina halalkaliphila]TRW47922.1 DNA polymerase III subunit chi [Aliidiomarina halalkaliphila]